MINVKQNKALLSIIISAFAVQTTQPIDWGWLTNNSIYKQGTELCSRISKTDTYKTMAQLLEKANKHKYVIAGSLAIGAIILYAKKRSNERNVLKKYNEELRKINYWRVVWDEDWQTIKNLIDEKKVPVDHYIPDDPLNEVDSQVDVVGYSALSVAIDKGCLDMVKWLISHGTDVKAFAHTHRWFPHRTAWFQVLYYVPDDKTPIVFAAQKQNEEIYNALVRAGANPAQIDDKTRKTASQIMKDKAKE